MKDFIIIILLVFIASCRVLQNMPEVETVVEHVKEDVRLIKDELKNRE